MKLNGQPSAESQRHWIALLGCKMLLGTKVPFTSILKCHFAFRAQFVKNKLGIVNI